MAELTLGGWAGEYVGAGVGKGVVCKFTAACLLSASWDKCSRNDGSQKHHPSEASLPLPPHFSCAKVVPLNLPQMWPHVIGLQSP